MMLYGKNILISFKSNFQKQYCKWMKKISKHYVDNEYGHEYINEDQDYINKYSNIRF